ncbi:putative Fungal STAND N-terminal Goodbye domain-containing protein [Seiridium cardinale]
MPAVTPITIGAAPPSAVLSPTRAQTAAAAQQKEIQAIWQQIKAQVIELAGGDPNKVPKNISIDGVLKYIDSFQRADKKKNEKFGWFKTTVQKTLQLIGNVGGIVAGAVSDVFAPASMCYSALTFVIQAWQDYEGMFENLAELLERCTDFLERLDYYDARMDARLARVAFQNLQLFVEICSQTIRLRKKRFRALVFVEQLFLKDNAIAPLLGMMDKLNRKESLLVNAQTFKLVTDSAGDIKMILENQKDQKKEDDAKKWRKLIAKGLRFPDEALGADEEPLPRWQRSFDSRKNTLVDGTGRWLLNQNEAFLDWAKSPNPQSSILVLEGDSGAGKTSLMANALRLLRKLEQAGSTSRAVTAYYFADADKKKSEDGPSNVVETVSRTLLWQIATWYEAMTKSMAQIAEKNVDFDNSLDLWQHFFLDNKERFNPDTTFFILIDSSDTDIQALIPLIKRLSQPSDGKKTRILLTASPQTTTDWLHKLRLDEDNIIPISEYNMEDIDLYIENRMDNMPILKDADRMGISEWRKEILKTLRRKCSGDYFKLDTSLSALARVDLIEDINDVLAQADKSRTDHIDSAIRQLNNIRTTKEIQEINEILLWVQSARWWVSVDMMEGVLSVKHQRRTLRRIPSPRSRLRKTDTGLSTASTSSAPGNASLNPSTTTLRVSLLPFSQKLRDKYRPLFSTENNRIDWGSAEVKDRIPVKDTTSRDLIGVSTMGPQVIHEAEISIVRHFLNNVCPGDLYERFEFEQFFDRKIGARNKDFICLEPENADLRIALTCLTFLTEGDLNNNPSLRKYAVWWLLEHLSAVDLSAASMDLKTEIGPPLVKLFTEKHAVDALLWPSDLVTSMKTWRENEGTFLRRARDGWLYSPRGVNEVARWLKDSAVTKSLIEEQDKAFVSAIKAPNANLHKEVLSHAAVVMADHMFRRVEYTVRQFLSAARFLLDYLARVHPERLPSTIRVPFAEHPDIDELEVFEKDEFTIEEVQMIESWASEVLDRSQETPQEASQWEFHGAMTIFQLSKKQNGAAEIYKARAQKAVQLYSHNWHACHFISKQTNVTDKEAIDFLLPAKLAMVKFSQDDKDWLSDHANSALLARIALELGDRMWSLGEDHALAAKTHRESLAYDYVRWSEYVNSLVQYQKVEAWSHIIAFFETVNGCSDTWAPFLDDFVSQFLFNTNVECTEILARAANITRRWDVIETFFTEVIDVARKQKENDMLFFARDGFAKTLESSIDENMQAKVITVQAEALEDLKTYPSDEISLYVIDEMADSLALSYLDMAFRPNLPPAKIASYGPLIESLVPDTDDTSDVWRFATRTCTIIRYHRKCRTSPSVDKEWIRKTVRVIIELLSDDDEENDDMAYWVLARLLTTIEDVENLKITWMLRNRLQYEEYTRWEAWEASQNKILPLTFAGTNGSTSLQNGETMAPTQTSKGDSPNGIVSSPPAITQSLDEAILGTKNTSNPAAPEESGMPLSRQLSIDTTEETVRRDSALQGTAPLSAMGDIDTTSAPAKPAWFASCHGCDKEWIILDEPLYTCADCVGGLQLCQECHGRLMRRELHSKKSARCRAEHSRFLIPAWDPSTAGSCPKGSVPLPAAAQDGAKWISMEEWKGRLKKLYVDV